ncbi:MAG: hypothetical protein QG632_572 [Candidatus Dependentiae bacterium]|nr:hypothetical protein [Candidatus Dependentiae bacterium]
MFKHVLLGFLLIGSGLAAADTAAIAGELEECRELWVELSIAQKASGLFNFERPLFLRFSYDFDDAHSFIALPGKNLLENVEKRQEIIAAFQMKYASFYKDTFSEQFLTSRQKNSTKAKDFTALFSNIFSFSRKIQSVLGKLKACCTTSDEEKK